MIRRLEDAAALAGWTLVLVVAVMFMVWLVLFVMGTNLTEVLTAFEALAR